MNKGNIHRKLFAEYLADREEAEREEMEKARELEEDEWYLLDNEHYDDDFEYDLTLDDGMEEDYTYEDYIDDLDWYYDYFNEEDYNFLREAMKETPKQHYEKLWQDCGYWNERR